MRDRQVLIATVLLACGCRGDDEKKAEGEVDGPPPWHVAASARPDRPGMAWIPPGVLIAGTPPGRLPRVADEELPGERIELKGFYIDRFNHPGEPGAIPLTGVSHAEARDICERQGKRLCTELEWERACKGPDNTAYEYGDRYDPTACATGINDSLAPNGLNNRCISGFGVRDMHGSAWNWTASRWARGSRGELVTVRGGNDADGERVGRCANGRGESPKRRVVGIGVRCCAGEVNDVEVELEVTGSPGFHLREPNDPAAKGLAALAPAPVRGDDRPAHERFRVERTWTWRPIGNEELVIGGGCARRVPQNACGVVVAREEVSGPKLLAWVSSDSWIPIVGRHELTRGLYVYGGDHSGAYRKPVLYEWGRVAEGGKHRKKGGGWVPPPAVKR